MMSWADSFILVSQGRSEAESCKEQGQRAFARAVVNAIGEISILEAQLAIRKYRDEWQAA